MLCDEIARLGLNGMGPDLSTGPIIDRIMRAEKFNLSPDFATVADQLSEDYRPLVNVMPFCRLPYPNVWFEVAQADRPNFLHASIHAPGLQSPPRRVGFLCEAIRNDLSAWDAHLFWVLDDPRIGQCVAGARIKIRFDMTGEDLPTVKLSNPDLPPAFSTPFVKADCHPGWASASNDIREEMTKRCIPHIADFGIEATPTGVTDRKWVELMLDLARADWAGEVVFLLSVVGLINARNATVQDKVDNTNYNNIRRKQGKRPLANHYVLKIANRQLKRVNGQGSQAATHLELRAHFCRGHFKRRATGIFFWHPHLRGHASRGHIEKRYQA